MLVIIKNSFKRVWVRVSLGEFNYVLTEQVRKNSSELSPRYTGRHCSLAVRVVVMSVSCKGDKKEAKELTVWGKKF